MAEREFLLDVSRLIWRAWAGRLPTGIDRVCLAYLDNFADRAQAVVQRGPWRRTLSPATSDRLLAVLRGGTRKGGVVSVRSALARLAPLIAASPGASRGNDGRVYLNVGHTGLDEPSLPGWIAQQRLRAVYLVHDLIPIAYPEFCRPGEDARHVRRMLNLLRSAAGVIGNSQVTIEQLRGFAARVDMPMPASVAAWLAGPAPAADIVPAVLDRPHFVTVGTIEGRKNHVMLLRIWQRLIASQGSAVPLLLVIGQRGWEAEAAFALLDRCGDLTTHVREMRRCEDAERARLVAGAKALLMPSYGEGFGLPVIEALQLGTPVIASDLPVFREIAAGIPTYLDPLDGPGWEAAIRDFAECGSEFQRQRGVLQGFTAPDWPGHFAIVEQWLRTM